MTIKEIKEVLGAEVLCGEDLLSRQIRLVCGSDLMSDVLAFIKAQAFLLTGLTNSQVVRTAEIADVICICFVRGKRPQKETIDLAVKSKIPLLTTKFSMYKACGLLFQKNLPSCDNAA